MESSIIFGETDHFAIRCIKNRLAKPRELNNYCHWILGNKLIGDPQEPCYLPLWLATLGKFKESTLPEILAEPELAADDIESIFNTLQEQGQEGEWKENSMGWESRRITLDETQDAWLLMAHREADGLRFTWKGWRAPCPLAEIGKVYSCWASTASVMKSIDECLEFYRADF